MPSPWLRGIYLLEIIFSLQYSSIPRSTFSNTTDICKDQEMGQVCEENPEQQAIHLHILVVFVCHSNFHTNFLKPFSSVFSSFRGEQKTPAEWLELERVCIYHTWHVFFYIFFPRFSRRCNVWDLMIWYLGSSVDPLAGGVWESAQINHWIQQKSERSDRKVSWSW